MRHLVPIVLMGAIVAISAGSCRADNRPAVVELFTSEGCSSCPPAEAYFGELSRRPDVLALAFHVDYWDDLGWRDRFGIVAATPRQRGYAKALRRASVYTPQMVVDGKEDFVGNDRTRIAKALAEVRGGVPVALAVRDGAVLIEIASQERIAASDVLLVAYQQSAVSRIGRGENSGRTLTEYNIVREVRRLGEYAGSVQSFRAAIASLPEDATDVAVLVQTVDQGPVIAAARIPLR